MSSIAVKTAHVLHYWRSNREVKVVQHVLYCIRQSCDVRTFTTVQDQERFRHDNHFYFHGYMSSNVIFRN